MNNGENPKGFKDTNLNKSLSFENLLKNKYINNVISSVSLVSFIIANLFIFYIISLFFNFSFPQGLATFVIGLLFSLFILKTSYFVDVGGSNSKSKEELRSQNENGGNIKVNIGIRNTVLIFSRLLFFNILNDLFIVLIFWVSFFGVIAIAGIVSLNTGHIQELVGIITILSIVSGAFQFYLKSYKEQITQKIITSLTRYFTKITKKISYNEFLEYVGNKESHFHTQLLNKGSLKHCMGNLK